jgi:glycosyltransferase involved in cell wall biosynthesis
MNIWVLQTGETLQIDETVYRPMRAINLSNALVDRGHKVILWSADFDHFSKKHRFGSNKSIKHSDNLEIRLIKSRGYKSNSARIARLIDHAQLGFNLKKMLKYAETPDVVFIGYPPIETAWVMTNWLRKQGVPSILDIKDGWPDTFSRIFPKYIRPIVNVFLLPYKLMMKDTLRKSSSVSAPTREFLLWAVKKADRNLLTTDIVAPLTLPDTNFPISQIEKANSWCDNLGIFDDKKFRVTFIGTLNNVFDFKQIFEAAKKIQIQFVIAGDGPQYSLLKEKAKDYKNIIMPGWIDSCQSKVLLSRSSVFLAPYRDLVDFEMSIPNKFYDAMSNGVPIISSITGVANNLIVSEKIGVIYSNSKNNSLSEMLLQLINNPAALLQMSKNTKSLFMNKYSFQIVYGLLTKHIEETGRK